MKEHVENDWEDFAWFEKVVGKVCGGGGLELIMCLFTLLFEIL